MPEFRRSSLPFFVFLAMLLAAGSAVQSVFAQAGFPSAVPQAANEQAPSTVAPSPIPGAAPAPPPPTQQHLVLLGPSDLVEVNVYNVPELSTKGRVSSSGDLYFPLIDNVHVDGLTPEEAQSVIEKRLEDGGFVKNPHVVLLVTDSSSSNISMLGEVNKPGPYGVLGERRLLDMISAAGGFTERAGGTVTITHRSDPGHAVSVKLPSDSSPDNPGNVPVLAGDTIMVQRGPVFYVVGDVGRPAGFVSDTDTFTVLKALALAGGPNRTASLNGSTILRKSAQGTQQIKIPLKQILRAKSEDVRMQSGDILFVPNSASKAALDRSVQAVTQLASGVALLAIHP
jgi:polysaccharide export outer membrane protein